MMHLSTHIDQQTVCKACSNDSINKKKGMYNIQRQVNNHMII